MPIWSLMSSNQDEGLPFITIYGEILKNIVFYSFIVFLCDLNLWTFCINRIKLVLQLNALFT